MITSISLQEGSLLVSGRAELGGPQFSKRPTVHLKFAFHTSGSRPGRRRKLIRSLVSGNLTVAWNVSEEEPTCPASSFFEIQLLALFERFAQGSYAPGWSLQVASEWHSQRTPNHGRIVPATRFALCPSTRVGPQQLPGAPPGRPQLLLVGRLPHFLGFSWL
jgi:hypothetical protein